MGNAALDPEEQELEEDIPAGLQVFGITPPPTGASTIRIFSLSLPGMTGKEAGSGECCVQDGETIGGGGSQASGIAVFPTDQEEERQNPGSGITSTGLAAESIYWPAARAECGSPAGPAESTNFPPKDGANTAERTRTETTTPALPGPGIRHASTPGAVDPVVVQGSLQKLAVDSLAPRAPKDPARAATNPITGHAIAGSAEHSRDALLQLSPDRQQGEHYPRPEYPSPERQQPERPASIPGVRGAFQGLPDFSNDVPKVSVAKGRRDAPAQSALAQPWDAPEKAAASAAVCGDSNPSSQASSSSGVFSVDAHTPGNREETSGNPAQRESLPAVQTPHTQLDSRKTDAAAQLGRTIPSEATPRQLAAEMAAPPEVQESRATLRELTVRLDAGAGRRVDMRFVETGGAVNLKLRTQDLQIASNLRSDIPQLETDLNSRGWKAELTPAGEFPKQSPGTQSADRPLQGSRAASNLGNERPGNLDQTSMNSRQDSDTPRRPRDFSTDEQELQEMAALRRLAAIGGLK